VWKRICVTEVAAFVFMTNISTTQLIGTEVPQKRKDKSMQKKKHKTNEKQAKARCPKCRQRIHNEPTRKEFVLYGPSIGPRYGDLTECGACGTVLECRTDQGELRLNVAPKWRSDLLNDMTRRNPSLSEIVRSIQARKPLRVIRNTMLAKRCKPVRLEKRGESYGNEKA
jgi:hypothetical protein